MGTWPAVALSSLIFGLGHAYQGPAGMGKTGLVGLVMALLTVASGSLVHPHAAACGARPDQWPPAGSRPAGGWPPDGQPREPSIRMTSRAISSTAR